MSTEIKVHSTAVVRNVRGFLKSYLQSDSGKKALQRGPNRNVWGNSAMAHALARAVANA